MKSRRRERITERENPVSESLDRKSTREILRIINDEDSKVPAAVRRVIPQVARAVDWAVKSITRGGRMIYLGAGTSGRLGVLDAAECMTTFGSDRIVAVLAGAPRAHARPVEGVEDDPRQGARDLRKLGLTRHDLVVGITASGRTPYTLGGLRFARRQGCKTVAITSNPDAPMKRLADVSIVPVVGPEVIAGSSRMKAGTAQKLVLNMLSTATMVRMGRVLSNWMINVQLANEKLKTRARAILARAAGLTPAEAGRKLRGAGWNLPVALLMHWKGISKEEAARLLAKDANIAMVLRQAQSERRRVPRRRVRA
ncbi:MAG TPA: N-acetylmuramic acid 6-phosphate etherase [Terriglobia bacterium]|jgi:N-acetylmuramic acid 6-phosphate etherase|nr:N-acetylmuramic acid 6-phosphate etherase [Terriglobia bacterium]